MLKLDAGLPWWLSDKEPTCQCRRLGFDPWSGKTPRPVEQQAHAPQPCSQQSRAYARQQQKPPQGEAQAA